MRLRYWLLAFMAVAFAAEYFLSWKFYRSIVPFPQMEFWYTAVSCFLRDVLLLGVAGLLYLRRKRIRDRVKRYFPVVVTGVLYLGITFFMVKQLRLDGGVVTTLAILTGLNNNLLVVLVTAMCYHKWVGRTMKTVYFAVYFLSAVIMIFDAFYFWQTSMHVQSVLFANLNIYAVKGVLTSMGAFKLALIGAGLVLLVLLFRVNKPTKKKPNFVWSLMCVAAFSLILNIGYMVMGHLNAYVMKEYMGMWTEVESEKTRASYREMLLTPVNVNFLGKMLFDTDKIVSRSHIEQRKLTVKDEQVLQELGIMRPDEQKPELKASYDKIVMLVLESVHRDYMHYYNDNIPAEATPYLDELLENYPHLDHYYSSAVPTTQGLNATFRSHLIYDPDLQGAGQPSIFRSVQQAGWRGIFMNASSHYYNNELHEYPMQFGMNEYYAKEYLEDAGYTGASGWGYHNDVLYKEALNILEKGKNDKMLLVVKTLDMHQPYPYYGTAYADMPENVRDNKYITVRGIYWVNYTIKNFFEEAERRGLMDDRTLFVITSDHNPHSGGEYVELVTDERSRRSIAPIPLIFVGKNLAPFALLDEEQYASQIDLAPTLLALAGIEAPEDFMGRDFLRAVDLPYALGYFGGKAYYYNDGFAFEDKMDEPEQDRYCDALTNYIIHGYADWHLKYSQ